MTLLPVLKPVMKYNLSSSISGGRSGLLDFLPPALRAGGMAMGTSRLFGSYLGPLARLRRGSDSVEMDVGAGRSRVSSEDVIGFVGKNLLRWTEDLTQANWSKVRCTPSLESGYSKVTASETNANGMPVSQSAGAVTASTRTVRFKTKKGSGDYCLVTAFDGSSNGCRQWFNLATGSVAGTNKLGSGWEKTDATITPDAGGEYLCTFSFTGPAANMNLVLYASTSSDLGYGCTIGDIGYITDIQLEYGSTATEYEARTTTGASPCLVPKLYDQLGSNDAVQTTGTQQPQIIPRQIGEMPILVGDGVDDRLRCMGLLTNFNDKDLSLVTIGENAYVGNANAPRLYSGRLFGYDSFVLNVDPLPRQVVSLICTHLDQKRYTRPASVAAEINQPRVTDWSQTPDFSLGHHGTGTAYSNPPQSTILLPTALSPANRAAVEAALMTEYQITP